MKMLKQITCDSCPKIFASRSSLSHHKKTHSGVNYNCTVCNKSFSRDDNLKTHYKDFNAKDIEIVKTRTYEYFPRWNMEETALGYHWDLYNLQGKNNMWFIGGSLSFESAHHVIGYNQLLLKKMRN